MTATKTSDSRRRWFILAVLGVAQLMVVLDATIVNIALPSAQRISGSPTTPAVDRHGLRARLRQPAAARRRIGDLVRPQVRFIVGLVGFAVASALGGAPRASGCSSPPARCRASSARCSPRPPSPADHDLHRPAERNKAFGVYGAIAGAGARGRPDPRRCADRVPRLALAPVRQPRLRRPAVSPRSAARCDDAAPRRRPRIDIPGAVTARPACSPWSTASPTPRPRAGARRHIGFLAAGVVLLAAFVAIERRVAHPLLPLRVVPTATAAPPTSPSGSRRRHVRRLPVPHLLPAADPGLLADPRPAWPSCR